MTTPLTCSGAQATLRLGIAALVLLGVASPGRAQTIPSVLTDTISQGAGTIDVLKDVSAGALDEYLDANGKLILGIDVNENASGNESSTSMGIAIESLALVLTTTTGTFTFNDFYTSTTASLVAAGSTTAKNYYTAFGQSGSSNINGSTSTFNLSAFDDVIYLNVGVYSGTILSASLQVQFLQTAPTGSNNAFFDYSGGFEDLALLGAADANTLEAANIGTASAPSTVTFASQTLAPVPPTPTSPGGPAPPLPILAGLAGLLLLRRTFSSR